MSPQDLKIDTLTTYKEGPTLSTDELIPHDKELSPDNQEPTPQIEMSTSVAKEPGPAPSTKRFECGFCGLTFKREFTRNIHKLDHTGTNLSLSFMGLTFSSLICIWKRKKT